MSKSLKEKSLFSWVVLKSIGEKNHWPGNSVRQANKGEDHERESQHNFVQGTERQSDDVWQAQNTLWWNSLNG